MIEVIPPVWDEARERAVFDGMLRRRRSRRVLRAALVALVAVAGWRLWPSNVVHFTDGSTAQLLEPDTVLTESPPATVHLGTGRARFEVRHDARRTFRVEAGEVVIEDLGTRFTVEKIAARARVAVEQGRVRVFWHDGATELDAGEAGLFPPTDVVQALWEEVDRARRLGRPAEAVAPLRKIVDSGDARAPAAAFTLGRILLDELHRPADAAAAFARARELAPDGPLAADARAREREARAAR
jgi:transmembrane sensor